MSENALFNTVYEIFRAILPFYMIVTTKKTYLTFIIICFESLIVINYTTLMTCTDISITRHITAEEIFNLIILFITDFIMLMYALYTQHFAGVILITIPIIFPFAKGLACTIENELYTS